MAKTKKSTKKTKFNINPENFERNLMFVLLIAFLVSAVVLLVRNTDSNNQAEIGEPSAAIERTEE